MDVHPLAPHQIEAEIHKLTQLLQHCTIEVGERARASAEASTAYKVKFSKELLLADGPMDVRRAAAEVACEQELRDKNIADALLLSAREAGHNARSRMDAYRTLASNVRSAVANPTGTGG